MPVIWRFTVGPSQRWGAHFLAVDTESLQYGKFAVEHVSASVLSPYRLDDISSKRRSSKGWTVKMNHQALRALPRASATAPISIRPIPSADIARLYATQSDLGRGSRPRNSRKNITVLSDDGRYEWGELSGREKVARATQQSFNFVVVLAGVVLTV